MAMTASSSLVIKVKYGDSLRRFSSHIVADELNFTMDGLRKKILSLFSFDADAELILTYVDEDGDAVTLADDDDLRDVVRQELNPLRITVKANAEKDEHYTPLTAHQPLQDPIAGVSEVLGTQPEPSNETVMKLSSDIPSKSSSTDRIQQPLQNLNPGAFEILKTVPEPLPGTLVKLSSESDTAAKETIELGTSAASNNESLIKLEPEANMRSDEVKVYNVNGGSSSSSRPSQRVPYPMVDLSHVEQPFAVMPPAPIHPHNLFARGEPFANPLEIRPSHRVPYPIMDLSHVEQPFPVMPPAPIYPHNLFASGEPFANPHEIWKMEMEEKLLEELEEMGFEDFDLNKRVLRMNEYDLGQAVDDLCGVRY